MILDVENAMSITASINPIQAFKSPNPFFDADGDPTSFTAESTMTRLAIQPRFECPIFDYGDRTEVALPTYGSGSVVNGTWHQFGKIPAQSKGVFMEIQDIPDEQLSNEKLTGSFASLVGFNKAKKKLGQVPSQRTVSEAIVAIPFFTLPGGSGANGNNQIHFYKIDKDKLGANAAVEMKDMQSRMKKYVLPPRFDFNINPDLDAVAMYIFEFKHTFNQKDMQNMWQNLPPESLMDIKEPKLTKKTISHELLPPDFFGPNKEGEGDSALIPPINTRLKPETRWLVFKVKQKADVNYFKKTIDSDDDSKFKISIENPGEDAAEDFVPDYSFNWPYDFFSMIELAKLDVKMDFE